MKFLQKLGKALMLPVAVLPICGILMGIGYCALSGNHAGRRYHMESFRYSDCSL